MRDLKEAVADYIERRGGPRYDGLREIVITSGEGDVFFFFFFFFFPPTYAGMVNRVRLVGAAPRFVPLSAASGEWRTRSGGAGGGGERAHPRPLSSAAHRSGRDG